ncbi:MAG: ATP-dependent DNA helicase RecG [Clostridia bacterium]|nr:ATP-dependent DNA helicase RecG [Clostridia bacterium]
MNTYTLESSVSLLFGVGKTKADALSRLGINTVGDLIYFFPRAYEKRGDVRLVGEAEYGIPHAFILTVASEVRSVKIKKGMTLSTFRAFDDSGSIEVTFFNSPFVKDIFHTGSAFRFYGKLDYAKNHVRLTSPKYEPYIKDKPLVDFIPIYPLREGLSSKFIGGLIKNALNSVLNTVKDPLPEDVRLRNSLCTLNFALLNIHFPENEESLRKAIDRLAFDEMLLFGLGISLSAKYKSGAKALGFSPCSLDPLTSLLPYELTRAQKDAINDIYKDTVIAPKEKSAQPMARIIVGDVGCGKTVCAAAAIYIAASSGFQSALMVPTEILARQHYKELLELFAKLGYKTELLIGATSQKDKKRIYGDLKEGRTTVVIGTHALLSDKVEFSNLGLVITDEQHRFGVAQRAVLKDKSKSAHLLVMSATPIPRTLALALYGDLDISRITEMPKGRMRVDTYVVNESYRERLNTFIERQVSLGGQCYIVCPSIEADKSEAEGEVYELGALQDTETELKNATEYSEELKSALPNLRIGLLHGKMKPSEKDQIMHAFSDGEYDVLVSTTVIEVGVNVPNASLMIVENADRFGLSQLHQLRGRVGRGTRKSFCVLVSDSKSEKAKARLEVMRTLYDGYEIADKDLALRGPGDFFSLESGNNLRQSGGFEFKLATLCDNKDLFDSAFSEAKGIMSLDPELALPEHADLARELGSKMKLTTSTIS